MLPTKKPYCQAYIALGSNLEDPVSQIQNAVRELSRLPDSRLICCSSLYHSAPVGRLDQPDFINAVAHIKTTLAPHDLLKALLGIEHHHGRIRESLNAPRTLDLDILLYDDLVCQDDILTIPHPRMYQRAFVLYPLMEIAPTCFIPGQGPVSELILSCAGQKLERPAVQNA